MRYTVITVLALALTSPVMVGCDKEVSHSEQTTQNPITGTETKKEQTTYQRSDGSTYTQSSKSSQTPANNP
jgi:hypothetical protein